MKAKINKNGVLEIERAGKFEEQECPRCIDYTERQNGSAGSHNNHHLRKCGDWCPFFGEPYPMTPYSTDDHMIPAQLDTDPTCKQSSIRLILCRKELCFNEKDFTDERINDQKKD